MSSAVDLKTKEEKDAELDKRIEALRKKNEALVKRYQEIEEDKKKAEQEGIAVTTPRKPRPHEPETDRRKTEKENFTVTVDLSKPTGRAGRRPQPHQEDGVGANRSGGQRGGGGGGGGAAKRGETVSQGHPEMENLGGIRRARTQRRRRGRGRGGEGGGGGGGGGGGTPGGMDRKSK
ncbi:hypothetical protein INR49_022557, partial [Caranx melampygus]